MDRPSQRGRGFGHHCILLPSSSWRVYITCHSTEKRTIPLRDCDIRLWTSDGHLISHSAGLEMLLQADSATICIANTKNGTKGAVVHHSRGWGSICSVAALAQRVANIQAGPDSGNINLVYHTGGRVSRVLDRDIGIAVRWGATLEATRSTVSQHIASEQEERWQ